MKMQRDGDKLTVFAQGRIDTNSAPEFASQVEGALDGVMDLTFDFSELEYISSSGLRVLMIAIKEMRRRRGEVRITNASEGVYDILESTGFTGACDVEMKA
ncbi:MAG: STAS domain-containing protein [Ruminococcaceae bacterium]|jgi:anti-sigma B factor antagonist|nr:STAS domain-containing protein [Oscillospiraceae bacterium]